jgi:hypothetical protein
VERTTTYQWLRVMEQEPDLPEPLDVAQAGGNEFGSYHALIGSDEFRWVRRQPWLS